MSRQTARGAAALGSIAIVFGCWGLVAAREVGWIAPRGVRLGAFVHLTLSGATVLLVMGMLALAGAIVSRRWLVLASAGLGAVGVVLAVAGAGRDMNLLGASGSTLSLLIGLAAGLCAIGIVAARPERASPTPPP